MKAVVISLGLLILISCASAPAKRSYGVTCFVQGQPIQGPAKNVKIDGTVVTITNDDGSQLTFVNQQCIIGSQLED